jgi:CheY-like chemotaxis protein
MARQAFLAIARSQAESRRNRELAEEKARLLEELKQQQQELLQASRMAALGTFSAGIAHEFNNILAAVMGQAQLGLKNDEEGEKNRSFDIIVRACRNGSSITKSLLTFARRREPDWGINYVQDAVEDTLALVERELTKNNITIVRRIEMVPPTRCDLGQIGQVVLNLLTNARDALKERSDGRVIVSLLQLQDQIELSVADNGVGIAPEVREKIFEPFVTTKPQGQGTGLGMSICYGIVTNHGGTIAVDSVVGQGTTMTIRLPITTTTPVPVSTPPRPLPTLNILLVGSDVDVSGALARLLRGRGHCVELAADGMQGLGRYRPRFFDVVVSDADIPDLPGIAFVERLRTLDPHIPVLMMRDQAGTRPGETIHESRTLAVLTKPFGVEELLAAITQVLTPSETISNGVGNS